jgi:hypothetical protein
MGNDMHLTKRFWVPATLVCFAGPLMAQSTVPSQDISGTWEVDTPDGRQQVIVRPDSSASFNEEMVRWRIYENLLYIAFGDEWVGYNFELRRGKLTLSGGDLEEPLTLDRVGPPTPLPEGVTVPPEPPFKPSEG